MAPDQHPLPFERSYWVVPGRLMAGFLPASLDPAGTVERCRGLVRSGVDTIIDLTEEGEVDPYRDELAAAAAAAGAEVHHFRHAVRDMDVPHPSAMVRILDAIDAALEEGRTVYVHCWGGRGRTGTVVGCWLVRHGLTGQAALARIASLRTGLPDSSQPSPETPAQRRFVADWREK